MLEYAETFAKKSYFQNYYYYDFYLNPEIMALVEYDFLFLRISACIFSQSCLSFKGAIHELYEEDKEFNLKTGRLDGREMTKKWVSFIGLISEAIVSNKTDIAFANIPGLKNEELEKE